MKDPLPEGRFWWQRLADRIADGLAVLVRLIGWWLRGLFGG
jgi:hypothetical protein